jgi:ribonuclease I
MPKGLETFTMFYKSRFWGCIVSGFRYGKNNKCSWSSHKDYFDKSSTLQSSVQEVKKYHNQILLDLFEDDKNEVSLQYNPTFQT